MNSDPFERGTYRELNRPRKRRGRPPAAEPRQPVQLWLLPAEYEQLGELAERWQTLKITRSQVLGLGIRLLNRKLRELRASIEGGGAELPLGLIDLDSLYLFWDLQPPAVHSQTQRFHLTLTEAEKWTLADMAVFLERAMAVNRSRVAGLAIASLVQQVTQRGDGGWAGFAELEQELLGDQDRTDFDVS